MGMGEGGRRELTLNEMLSAKPKKEDVTLVIREKRSTILTVMYVRIHLQLKTAST